MLGIANTLLNDWENRSLVMPSIHGQSNENKEPKGNSYKVLWQHNYARRSIIFFVIVWMDIRRQRRHLLVSSIQGDIAVFNLNWIGIIIVVGLFHSGPWYYLIISYFFFSFFSI